MGYAWLATFTFHFHHCCYLLSPSPLFSTGCLLGELCRLFQSKSYSSQYYCLAGQSINVAVGPGRIVQWFRALVALAENSLISHIYIVAHIQLKLQFQAI